MLAPVNIRLRCNRPLAFVVFASTLHLLFTGPLHKLQQRFLFHSLRYHPVTVRQSIESGLDVLVVEGAADPGPVLEGFVPVEFGEEILDVDGGELMEVGRVLLLED